MSIKIWEVGGHVRDSLLGIESKDIDMAVEAPSWEAMRAHVVENTKQIFMEKPEFLTIRAMGFDGLPKDFVLCRKDGAYSDGRHPDSVEPGTILDDLKRRDFTINAIARDPETGELFDPFKGSVDLEDKILRCVGSAKERFEEDALRIIRALRFMITKDLSVDFHIGSALFGSTSPPGSDWGTSLKSVSTDRIREELDKCFRHDTKKTLHWVSRLNQSIFDAIFINELWLKPTTEKR